MTQAPQGPVVKVKPQANVYSVLLVVAIAALAVAIGLCLWRLLSPVPVGYGLDFSQLFDALKEPI